MNKMKTVNVFVLLLSFLFVFSCVCGQSEETVMLTSIRTDDPVTRMVWNESGNVITLVTKNSVQRIAVSDPADLESFELGEKSYFLTTVSEAGVVAAISEDMNTIYLYDPESSGKELRTIQPGFGMLSVSVSKDGSQVVADSAEQIRTVVFDAADGSVVHDLSGFGTAAPVYDSSLSDKKDALLWHARGTFALQDVADGSFGNTISLWDFASGFALSPDNKTLAVGIINDDYENGAVIFFDPVSGQEKGRTILGSVSPYEVSFSNDGTVLWAADAETVYRIDPKSFELDGEVNLVDIAGNDRISYLAASPNGQTVAVLMRSGELLLVNK